MSIEELDIEIIFIKRQYISRKIYKEVRIIKGEREGERERERERKREREREREIK